MARHGQGMLVVFTNVAAALEAEFNRWYDREHLQERVEIPGFHSARRYVRQQGHWKYLALYETDSVATLESPEYRQRLANQSAWSKQMLGQFVEPHRAVARVSVAQGLGTGGVVGVLRLPRPAVHEEQARTWLASTFAPRFLQQDGAVAMHLLESDPRLSQPIPEYPPVADPRALPDDWFLLLDVTDAATLAAFDAARAVSARVAGTAPVGVYRHWLELSRGALA